MYEDDLTVSGVEYTNNSGIVIVEGTDDYAIDLTGNAIAGPLVATVLPPLNTALNGFTYRPFTAAVINAPYLWPMDVVTFTDRDGNNHTSALTNVAFGLNGTTAMESKGMTYAINKLAQPKGFTREQAQLVNQAMEHVEQDIDESLTQQEIFNRLTDDGAAQGLVLYNGQLYINASYINAGYLSADRIAAGAISADKIAAGAITTDKIAANAITASKIAAGAITADMITSGEMSAARIKGGTLTLGGIGNTRGSLEILNGFDQVCGGWNNSRMFANGFQLTAIVNGELEIDAEIVPLAGGGVGIHNHDDSSDWLAYFDPDQASFNNNLYVGNNAIIHGALYLGEALAVQEGGTGATTEAGARANLGITPANIGAVAKAGDAMTGKLTFNQVQNAIAYTGTIATYDMIKFIDNTADTYGNGVSIGGGGAVIIGGGESANVATEQVTGGNEVLYLCNDGDVNVFTNMQNGWSDRKTFTFGSNGTLTAPAFSGPLIGNVTGNCSGSSGSCIGNAATATKATQDGSGNNIVSRYLPYNTAGGIASCEGGGQNLYYKIATIKITGTYINRPIVFEISGRGHEFSLLQVLFYSSNNIDPALYSFTTNNNSLFWIKKTATSTWEIYGKYNETWGSACVHRITGMGADIGVTVNMTNAGTADSVISGATQASYGGNASYASSAGSVAAGNISGAVAVDHGGTGATTAAGARTNLGIQPSVKTVTTDANGYADLGISTEYIIDYAYVQSNTLSVVIGHKSNGNYVAFIYTHGDTLTKSKTSGVSITVGYHKI
jgi:hypothetical protein